MIVDLFAGGGGTSLGIEMALGRSPDVAINHSAEALAMHEVNHPRTRHLAGDVWDYAPREVAQGREVELLWASPDCRHFSKCKGSAPRSPKIRSLAWVAVRWAREVRPRTIIVENVEELQSWGPLLPDGRPCPARKGITFQRWLAALRGAGYQVEHRELRACDYGAPTTRKRLFVVARLDGHPVWPAPTHTPATYRSAASCIEWSIPCPSIYGRARPLAPATMRRIERGMKRFVLEHPDPYVVDARVPWLVHQSNGERVGQAPRIYDIQQPLGTIVAGGVKHALTCAFLAKHYGGNEGPGSDLRAPLSTITTQDHHGLVTVHGERMRVVDVGHRMLVPRELFRAQGFPDSWVIDPIVNGKPLPKTAQIRMVGNSVSPQIAAAIVAANVETRRAVAA